MIFDNFMQFLIHWGITSISLWVASHIFSGIKFSSTSALVVSALLLGFANAVLRPLLLILTFPLTLITLGLFVLVINALMLQLVRAGDQRVDPPIGARNFQVLPGQTLTSGPVEKDR